MTPEPPEREFDQMNLKATGGGRLLGQTNAPILIGGLVFLILSVAAFVVAMFLFWISEMNRQDNMKSPLMLASFYPELILCSIGVFGALLGVSLLRAAGAASIPPPGPVVSPGEWATLGPEVKAGREDPISQYVRLRSLTGFPGLFTKLGLTGLPLATIALTIFFSLMFYGSESFLDLAKLTLGAFIGSFVQKQVGERQASGGTVTLPSGEELAVKRPSPPTVA